MKYRFLLAMALALAVSLGIACGSDDDNNTSSTQATPQVTQAAGTQAPAGTSAAGASPAASPSPAALVIPLPKATASVTLQGAGATFPAPFYTKAFDDFNKGIDTNVRVNYQGIGSSGGITNFTQKTVDFGATDAFMSAEQMQTAGGAEGILHVPTAIDAVVLTYNLPGFSGNIRMTPELVAGVFLGDIKKWNDPKILAENQGIRLPDAEIAIVHRSDGSGTTSIFTNYLAAVNDRWKSEVGAGTSVKWPSGIGAQGNDGVTGQIRNTPGSLGYVGQSYADQQKLPQVELKNRAGTWVKATAQASSLAAADVSAIPADFRANIVNSSNPQAWPITGFTWILAYKNQTDQTKGSALVNLLWWMTHDGQKVAESIGFNRIPTELVPRVETALRGMTINGQPAIRQ